MRCSVSHPLSSSLGKQFQRFLGVFRFVRCPAVEMGWSQVPGLTLSALKKGRVHVIVNARFITLVYHNSKVFCFDSACYHGGGPLGEGEIRDIEDIPSIRCPWHGFLIAMDTGERVEREFRQIPLSKEGVYRPPVPTFPLQPWPDEMFGPPKRKAVVQRVHAVDIRGEDSIWVDLPTEWEAAEAKLGSDTFAIDEEKGRLCIDLVEDRKQEASLKETETEVRRRHSITHPMPDIPKAENQVPPKFDNKRGPSFDCPGAIEASSDESSPKERCSTEPGTPNK